MWTMTDIDRESRLLPIRIPLLKGLLGYRICIVNKGDEEKFSKVKSLQDFIKQGFTVGQGHDWPDTKILRANGISVVESTSYNGLFHMLTAKRFDCFARGTNEPWNELANQADKNLAIDRHIAFFYRAPLYYFVNSKQVKLAERIEKGLRAVIADGSFNKLFQNHHQKALEKAGLDARTIIKLDNPLMPPKTPIKEEALWLKI
jgi:hypothetical protein